MNSFDTDFHRLDPRTVEFLKRAPRHFIGGEWQDAAGGGTIPVINPATAEVISAIAAGTAADIDRAVAAAKAALEAPSWKGLSPDQRERLMHRLADLVEANIPLLTEFEVLDNGMTMHFAKNLALAGAVGVLRYMAGWPSKIHGRTVDLGLPIPGSKFFAATMREPVGVVGAIVPWNVPFMTTIWKVAPALAAGCTVVVKPAEDACLSVLKLAELVAEAGFPPGVVNVVTGTGIAAGEPLVSHPDVAKISFTGSTVTGKRIGAQASGSLKKVTLELGGKSPNVIFADADLDRAATAASDLIFLNSGQVCVAGSRLCVERKVLDRVVDAVSMRAASLKVGSGFDPATEIGPLVSARQQQRVRAYIEDAKAEGATVLTGGEPVDSAGFFVRPAVVVDTRQDMKLVQEEVFGPVLAVMPFDDLDQVTGLANDTAYGLAATVWTTNLKTAHEMISRLRSGFVAINSDAIPHPALPQGGFKQSGVGKDLSVEAIEGCLDTKTVLIRYD
ncbi:MAG: aldehyde dehydrogenase family protein [Devosia nanyangense]|uniref:Aldehyde dehydrogenase family protein n=1 Tax=Devosia nanyangense TaxID=1228055 RepID=A0A933L0Y2_9HYPH|nr:aldehyde dehydrogenase family protein [Devosia nanyangense]